MLLSLLFAVTMPHAGMHSVPGKCPHLPGIAKTGSNKKPIRVFFALHLKTNLLSYINAQGVYRNQA